MEKTNGFGYFRRFFAALLLLISVRVIFVLFADESKYLFAYRKQDLPNPVNSSSSTATAGRGVSMTKMDNNSPSGNHRDKIAKVIQILSPVEDSKRSCLALSEELWTTTGDLHGNESSPVCASILQSVENGTSNDEWGILSEAAEWAPPQPHDDDSVLNLVKNCKKFLKLVQFPKKPSTQEEADFPLAYVFMAQRNAAQTVRLFRMLYQPQNAYCIAYDMKSSKEYINTILSMASCFPSNVFVNPRPESIHYFGYSILRSVMTCMDVLRRSRIGWRYVQVVSWNDFPLRTNFEMVEIFKILNGSQDCELLNNDTPDYVTYQLGEHGAVRRSVPPGGLTFYKGSFATSMSREFVDFIFNSDTSVRLYKYLEDAKCPEEYYWPTLVHNIQLQPPGGFPGQCEVFYTNAGEKKPFLSRFQVWEWDKGDRQCKGKFVYLSCVYGVHDLPMLMQRMELIAHKMYEEFEPALLYCLEEWYWEKVCDGRSNLDWSYYQRLPSVLYHKLSDVEKGECLSQAPMTVTLGDLEQLCGAIDCGLMENLVVPRGVIMDN